MRCEDYPCCGHTNDDPCDPQPYDRPDYFDTTVNPHALCDHAAGICDVWEDMDDEPCSVDEEDGWCFTHDRPSDECDGTADERTDAYAEDAFLDGSWEE